MKRHALFLGIFTSALLAVPAFAADSAPGMTGVRWGKNVFNFEDMPSGAKPLRNLSRRPDGTANAGQLVGDYHNPILTPQAASVVKQKGELAISGKGFPNAQDQCRAIAPPFSAAMTLGFQMLQRKNGDLVMISDNNANTRHIRMNGTHPANLRSTPMGDSIGRFEGDTLVIDTVGVKVDAFMSVDRFGTPLSEAMHVIERYRLIDGAVAKAASDAYEKREGSVGGGGRDAGYHPDSSLKGLQLDLTMEDPKVFTAPLTVRVTYRRLNTDFQENVCADNPVEHYKDEWIGLPKSDRPDF
jgi:hypothetical protein